MSFDLYFCWQTNAKVDFGAVSAWANQQGNFNRKDNQLWYDNPITGVYFSLDFDPQGPTTPEESPIPPGYYDSGLAFNLNFNRPSFFGREAMPYVEQLASQFGLFVVDNQADKGPVLLTQVESSMLVDSWLRHNEWAIRTLLEDPSFSNPLRMPESSSMYLWRYQSVRQGLQRACGEDVFAPNLVPMHLKDNRLVERGFTFTHGVPTIVPDAEWVFVVLQDKSGIFHRQRKQKVGVISIETFRAILRDCVQPYEPPELNLRIIPPNSITEADKRIRSIERMLDRSEFVVVGYDSFVDVELPS